MGFAVLDTTLESIAALNARAWAIRYDTVQEAITLAHQALQLAGPADTPRSRREFAASLRTLSHSYELAGEYTLAIEYAKQALNNYRKLGDHGGIATALRLVSGSAWSLGDYFSALVHARECIAHAEQAQDWAELAQALNMLGLVYQSTGSPHEALRYFTESCELSQRINEQRSLADTLHNRAEITLQLGHIEEAYDLAQQSLALTIQIGYFYDHGMALALVADIEIARGQQAEAKQHLIEAIASAETYGNRYAQVVCLIPLGLLVLRNGEHAQAEHILLRALRLAEELEVKDECRECHQALVELYEQHDLSKALHHFRQMHTLTEELRTNATMHQLKILELLQQIEHTEQKHAELTHEIVERRHIEQQLNQRITELSLLQRTTELVVYHTDLETLLDQISFELMQLLDARGIIIALYDFEAEQVHIIAANDHDPAAWSARNLTLPMFALPISAQVLQERHIVTLNQHQALSLLGPLSERFAAAGLQQLKLVPLIVRNEIIGVLAITSDQQHEPTLAQSDTLLEAIASQLAAAIEHTRLFAVAQQAQTTAERASNAKSRFLATMSHEIRTPLAGMLGYAQLLQLDPTLAAEHREQIVHIEGAGRHLLMLLNDILDLARIEADKLQLEQQVTNLPILFEEVMTIFALEAQHKGLQLALNLSADAQLFTSVLVDARRLRQVLLNLIGNAIKFTKKGGVTCLVHCAPPQEPHGRHVNQPVLRIAIRDTGIGIAEADIQLVLTAFYQSVATDQIGSGLGLGLAITSELLKRMGSELHLQSTLHVGSEFWFDLPLQLAAQADLPAITA
jgi:signal transduction histidine kinase